jgi:hypothetical protein
VNVLIIMNGEDVTDSCLLSATRIAFDSSRRITTAQITVMGAALARTAGARYDAAHYDVDRFAAALTEMFQVQIIDGRDGTTKLFDGQIYALSMQQSDANEFSVWYECSLNDWAAWLDRSVCWNRAFPLTLPNSDRGIILALLGEFCPKIHLTDIDEIVPVIQKFDWATKSCRQVLDELSVLSMANWRVDFDANLHYHLASAAPAAPFGLSTSPDYVNTFPVRVDGYRHDFSNPINHAYVRGTQDPTTGVTIAADYADPVSIQTYGEYSAGLVDEQIVTGWDAALKAKSIVLASAYPIETGNFTIWGRDGLQCGMLVHLVEESIGIDDDYIIRALTMEWVDKETVQYTAQFGAAQPDLETILRMLDQRTRWKTSNVPVTVSTPGPPPDGSVTDASIAPPGLSASSIKSVSSSAIQGMITADQIGSVSASVIQGQVSADHIGGVYANTLIGKVVAGQIDTILAGQIAGSIQAYQIASVNASAIQGAITADKIDKVDAEDIQGAIVAGQIGSVNATTIQGVIVTSQLANQIIDDLAKYAPKLAPIPMVNDVSEIGVLPNDNFPANSYFYYVPNGGFYRITPDGTSWAQDQAVTGSQRFYHVGAISANMINGLIVASQIGSVNASTLNGQVQAGQINTVTAGQITGYIHASQIDGVNASVIVGQITADKILTVNATAIQGSITSDKIGGVLVGRIEGLIQAAQIKEINAGQIAGTIAAAQIGTITAGQITGTLAYNQIGSINATTITIGQLVDSQIAGMSGAKLSVGSVNSDKFNGYSIDVGGAGNKPGRIRVFNDSAATVAQIGVLSEVGLNDYGGWFKVLGAGGAGYSSAKVYTDASGNLFIRDADLNIGNGVLTTSPATFDASYSVLAWKATNSPDSASFFSRGIVLYYNGSKIGALVRGPVSGVAELEFGAGTSNYVLIRGTDGVRSDQGFSVGGAKVINSSGQFTGQVTGTFTGTVTGSVNTGGTVNATGGHTGGPFTGSSVNTPGSCTAGSYNVGGTSVINSSGQFVGPGVVTTSGIGAAGFNPTGWTGQTYNVAFRDAAGNYLKLYINGVDRGFTQMIFVGGVLVSYG